jgi:hypothetical protein
MKSTATAKRKAVSVYLPPALAERIERVQRSRAAGSALPPLAALVVAAAELGVAQLETGHAFTSPKESL